MTSLNFGFPRMHKEPGERRDFTPEFIGKLHRLGASIRMEHGYGAEMGLRARDYLHAAPSAQFVTRRETYQQDYVVVLRCPTDDELRLLHPAACLVSMLHYPTRPGRVKFLRSLGVEAISLDSLKDDSGRRLVENLRAVGWNGLEAAFQAIAKNYPPPGLYSSERLPIQVTVLGPGAVGVHAIQAATNYGNRQVRRDMVNAGVPGVQVTTLDYDLTRLPEVVRPILARTDILVDATQRPNPSQPVIPNSWIGEMPEHAVLVDLSVDPYDCDERHPIVKGLEGIPQGNLDQYVFEPNDPAYERVPGCVDTRNRRTSVSCYSWPGIYPKECMELYGKQIQPILRAVFEKGGVNEVNPHGRYFERIIGRALLSRWAEENNESNNK